ncbi:MAG: hypothetical protein AAGN66_02955 [Acidobacteriota bacterium]
MRILRGLLSEPRWDPRPSDRRFPDKDFHQQGVLEFELDGHTVQIEDPSFPVWGQIWLLLAKEHEVLLAGEDLPNGRVRPFAIRDLDDHRVVIDPELTLPKQNRAIEYTLLLLVTAIPLFTFGLGLWVLGLAFAYYLFALLTRRRSRFPKYRRPLDRILRSELAVEYGAFS